MKSAPLAVDLFCGLGGWTEGLLMEGYRVVGFDLERHRYPAREFVVPDESSKAMGGKNKNGTTLIAAAREQVHGFHRAALTGEWAEYPAQLVLQDVLTIHGRQFKDAALIVASPPCQAWSMAGKGGGRRDVEHVIACSLEIAAGNDTRAEHAAKCEDARSMLVVEPLRWALALEPTWIAFEQVPPVLELVDAVRADPRAARLLNVDGRSRG